MGIEIGANARHKNMKKETENRKNTYASEERKDGRRNGMSWTLDYSLL